MGKKLSLTSIAVLTALVVWWLASGSRSQEVTSYEFAHVERGSIEVLVSATGTLSASETVEVGTQISGTVAGVLVDFNEPVQEGQLLAIIDTDLLDTSVREAEAMLARAEAELTRAEGELARMRPLHDQGLVSEEEFSTREIAVFMAEAGVMTARAGLDRAKRNRENAEIRSPIDGVVIERAVERGQTVAASLSSPTLFLLAADLQHMEILTNVDESDIGQIRDGQAVRFTVATHPDEVFTGAVEEIRLQPQVISNVVTYTVVVEADNEDGLLLPGMTATVDFVVSSVNEALVVPSVALRLEPTAEMIEAVRARREGELNTTSSPRAQDSPTDRSARTRTGRSGSGARLWYLDASGELRVALVETGVTDGLMAQIVPRGDSIEEGMQVIARATGEAADRSTERSQNLENRPRGGRRMGL